MNDKLPPSTKIQHNGFVPPSAVRPAPQAPSTPKK